MPQILQVLRLRVLYDAAYLRMTICLLTSLIHRIILFNRLIE